MEDLLQNIIKEGSGQKLSVLRKSAQDAHDLLCSQNNLLRNPSHELRAACFLTLRLALESKRSKLVSLALTGLHKIVRDERFQAGTEPEDDSLWLPAQLLHATTSMPTHSEDTQVHILRVLLSLACSSSWALNGRLVMLLLGRCGEACETGTQPVRAAAQAAASQTVRAFTTFLDEECQEILQQQQKNPASGMMTPAVACFNEAIPVMQYICSRLEESRTCPKSNETTVFLLECLLTLVSTLPKIVHTNTHFTTFLWQRFCPALISLLGAPGETNSHSLSSQQAKTVYSIGIQLVRLVGCVGSLRPVLEALFHRMALLPAAPKRLEPLRSLRELLRSPERLVDLLLLPDCKEKPSSSDDMAIIRLIMDSIEESALCNDTSVMLASVECVVAMLTSLDALCKGEGISHDAAALTNIRYSSLEQADYKGPLTYQSLARLPKPYRDVVANLKYSSDSDSSGIDGGPADPPREDGESDSDDSGATEGPEDIDHSSDDSIMDDESFLTSQELSRLQKLPKSLHLGRTGIDECNVDVERHNAKHFVKTLQNILIPNLLSLRSSIQIDEVLQEFASKCCEHNAAQTNTMSTIMNADGIYLATYSALLLNLKLIQLDYYNADNKNAIKIPLTEDEFVDEVHGSGVLVYLSATWLSELYQHVLATSLLEDSGYDSKNNQQYALINLLTDVGGLSQNKYLTEWQKLERVHGPQKQDQTSESEAGIKLSRRVLTCCWDSMVIVLSGALTETSVGPLGSLGGKASKLGMFIPRRARRMQGKKKVRDNLIASSLDGLHKAASLSNILKLQSRSSSILALLSSSACQSSSNKLHAAHALSLDVLLSKGLALGSHSSDCWPHVFAACVHVARLEHALFSKAGTQHTLMVAQQNANTVVTSTAERLNLSFNLSYMSQEEETCVDVYSFLQSSNYSFSSQNSSSKDTDTTIATIVNKSGAHNTSHGLLSNVDAAKVCCVLSQEVDTLFHEAALKLNLPILCAFLEELCNASQRQLFARSEESSAGRKRPKWWRKHLMISDAKTGGFASSSSESSLLLHRIGDVTLKCIRAGRPLVHTMRVWSIVGPHLMEAACHRDHHAVAKVAITCIHDAVTALLNEQLELPHFHFNEALFKPFENLLCLELCDLDIQDQIVSCICEFVEANRIEIRSGWRPLFGTLRVANSNASNNAAAILEVFQVFLSTDNTLVFANAALDYILCLLTHIRGADNNSSNDVLENNESPTLSPTKTESAPISQTVRSPPKAKNNIENIFQFLHSSDKSTGFFDIIETKSTASDKTPNILSRQVSLDKEINLCIESLKLLENCVTILAAMYDMPKCPPFNMAHRIQIDTQPQLVDSVIQNIDVISFNNESTDDNSVSYKILSTVSDLEQCVQNKLTLTHMDKPSGILKIWYILLEGLASATIICVRKNQPYVLETLFKLLRDLINCPGKDFGLYCINHLLLPMVQNWLRQSSKGSKICDNSFKQCCGMASELVVEYLFHIENDTKETSNLHDDAMTGLKKDNPASTLVLKQLLLILVECVIQPNESIARLGASCMRHIILSSGHILSPNQWEIVVTALYRACTISLNPLQQLTLAFEQNSYSFYGDLAVVKVAARKDCTVNENLRLNQLAQQVFLLASQRDVIGENKYCASCQNKKSPTEQNKKISTEQNKIAIENQNANLNNSNNSKCSNCDKKDDMATQIIIDDRSYVFLLYPNESASSLNPDMYTVRVPFRSLIVGVLAHQMLVQTIASVLLQNLSHVTPISIILRMTNNHNLRGALKNIDTKHIGILLKCLEMSNLRAKEFDGRPGLKFLTQKVGNLEKAANLYSQSSTSEIVRIIILIELCLTGIEKYNLGWDEIKNVVENKEFIVIKQTDLEYVYYFLCKLKTLWEDMCDSYINLSLNFQKSECSVDNIENCIVNESANNVTEKIKDEQQTSSIPEPFKLSDFNKNDDCLTLHDNDLENERKCNSVNDDQIEVNDKTVDGSNVNEFAKDDGEEAVKNQNPEVKSQNSTVSEQDKPLTKQRTMSESSAKSTSSVDENTPTTEQQVEAMMEQYRNRKPLHLSTSNRLNPFTQSTNSLPQPQPVPVEIQQQRALSIRKDIECYKSTRLDTMSACLELLESLHPDRIIPLFPVLRAGAQSLFAAPCEHIRRTARVLILRMEVGEVM